MWLESTPEAAVVHRVRWLLPAALTLVVVGATAFAVIQASGGGSSVAIQSVVSSDAAIAGGPAETGDGSIRSPREPTEEAEIGDADRTPPSGTSARSSNVAPVPEKTTTRSDRSTTSAPPTTTQTTMPVTIAEPPSTVAPTTAAPVTAAPTVTEAATTAPTAGQQGCHPNYSGCVPIASDVDCAGGTGDGPAYVQGPVNVIGKDVYRLDADNDGVGCETN